MIELDGVEKDLTPGEKLTASFTSWASDGKVFYVQTNERDPRFFDCTGTTPLATRERSSTGTTPPDTNPAGVSPDGKWIPLIKTNTWTDSDIYLWNAETKEARHLTPHEGAASYEAADFDPAGKHLYLPHQRGSEFKRLKRYELASGKHEEVERAAWTSCSRTSL